MRKLLLAATTAAGMSLAGAASAADVTLFSTDFNSTTAYSGVIAVTTGGTGSVLNNSGCTGTICGAYYHNGSGGAGLPSTFFTVTLANLPALSGLAFDFTGLFQDSWDSTNGSPAPDYLEVYANGALVTQLTADNASGNVLDIDGGMSTAFGNFFGGSWNDRVFDSQTYASSPLLNTFTLAFRAAGAGWQGGDDESFGLDNIVITGTLAPENTVPEPATWALLIGGFGLAGASLRRRRAAAAA
jgi:hypothetical protein